MRLKFHRKSISARLAIDDFRHRTLPMRLHGYGLASPGRSARDDFYAYTCRSRAYRFWPLEAMSYRDRHAPVARLGQG